jgi:hypothetical protein
MFMCVGALSRHVMAPSGRPALTRRGTVGSYSLRETALLMAALSVLPLAPLAVAAAPALTAGGLVGGAGALGTASVARRLRNRSTAAQVCVPHTEVCAEV